MRALRLVLVVVALFAALPAVGEAPVWAQTDARGEVRLHLWFFWSRFCPHCREALPFVEKLGADYPWLDVHVQELVDSAENRERYVEMARLFGQEARSVPAFFYCDSMRVGYETAETTGAALRADLLACRERVAAGRGASAAPAAALPGLGALVDEDSALPLVTAAIAGLDAFNPCAFFVLLFLLSLLVHARDRRRMLLVGGVFVFFSGAIYFLFMAAWLNLFLLIGELRLVTALAGLVAVGMALLNLKDYVRPGVGPSLSISDQAKPGLFKRMRGLLQAERLGPLLAGTVVLAVSANTYELLCTSGLPMVYTRILTLRQLPEAAYYGYLLLYNVIYVLPLLAIVLLFTRFLGAHKLQAHEGRLLKLLSGLMMLGLGLVLLLRPTLLDDVATAFAIIAGAVVVTAGVYWREKRA